MSPQSKTNFRRLVNILQLLVIFLLSDPTAIGQPQWRVLPNGPVAGGRHDDVFFLNADTGWVVNGNGEIHKTTDGGASWENLFNASVYFRCVGFANAMNGWAGTLDHLEPLYATTDGGESWAPVANIADPRPESICGIWAVNDSVVFASGAYWGVPRVIKTADAGATWTSVNLSLLAGALVDCYFFNEDSGFVVGSSDSDLNMGEARVLFTADGGTSWQQRYVGTRPGELCWKITFTTENIGFVSIEDFVSSPPTVYYLKTTDRGQTWEDKVFRTVHYDEQGIGFATPTTGWIGGWGGPTYETTDGGDSWHLAGFGVLMNRFRFLSDTLGYAVGQRVYKYSNDTTTTSAQEPPLDVPHAFGVTQNYPNPFNPTTIWRYSIDRSALVVLKVFDVIGREVRTLVNDRRDPGTYEVTFDGRGLPSGMYVYRLIAGEFVDSKKMVLLR